MAHRTFVDESGLAWEVWDVTPSLSTDGGAPGTLLHEDAAGGWLAFQRPDARRRFYQVPDGWETFTDAQLSRLLKHAVVVRPAG